MATKVAKSAKTVAAKAAMRTKEHAAIDAKTINIEEQIRRLAYQKWEAAGRPHGDGVCYWFEAERELWHW
jgi:hypothetical protein